MGHCLCIKILTPEPITGSTEKSTGEKITACVQQCHGELFIGFNSFSAASFWSPRSFHTRRGKPFVSCAAEPCPDGSRPRNGQAGDQHSWALAVCIWFPIYSENSHVMVPKAPGGEISLCVSLCSNRASPFPHPEGYTTPRWGRCNSCCLVRVDQLLEWDIGGSSGSPCPALPASLVVQAVNGNFFSLWVRNEILTCKGRSAKSLNHMDSTFHYV